MKELQKELAKFYKPWMEKEDIVNNPNAIMSHWIIPHIHSATLNIKIIRESYHAVNQ